MSTSSAISTRALIRRIFRGKSRRTARLSSGMHIAASETDFIAELRISSLSVVKKLMKKGKIKTVRRSGLTHVDRGNAILQVAEQDPLGRFGCRLTKEKLRLEGTHIPRYVMLA
jgi:hypothetical protein